MLTAACQQSSPTLSLLVDTLARLSTRIGLVSCAHRLAALWFGASALLSGLALAYSTNVGQP